MQWVRGAWKRKKWSRDSRNGLLILSNVRHLRKESVSLYFLLSLSFLSSNSFSKCLFYPCFPRKSIEGLSCLFLLLPHRILTEKGSAYTWKKCVFLSLSPCLLFSYFISSPYQVYHAFFNYLNLEIVSFPCVSRRAREERFLSHPSLVSLYCIIQE